MSGWDLAGGYARGCDDAGNPMCAWASAARLFMRGAWLSMNASQRETCRSGHPFSDPVRTLNLGPAQVSDCADSPGPPEAPTPCGCIDGRSLPPYSSKNLIHYQTTL